MDVILNVKKFRDGLFVFFPGFVAAVREKQAEPCFFAAFSFNMEPRI